MANLGESCNGMQNWCNWLWLADFFSDIVPEIAWFFSNMAQIDP